jgi:hypothetical protein
VRAPQRLVCVSCRVARTAGFFLKSCTCRSRVVQICLTLYARDAQEVTAAIYELLAGQAWWRRYEASPNMPNRPYFTALLQARGALAAPERARLRDFSNSVMGALCATPAPPRARRGALWPSALAAPHTLRVCMRTGADASINGNGCSLCSALHLHEPDHKGPSTWLLACEHGAPGSPAGA